MKAKKPLIHFFPQRRKKGQVTKTWAIRAVPQNQYSGDLGTILWYTAWRRYVYEPSYDVGPWTTVVFDATCLRTIADFCEEQTLKHRAARKRLKEKS